MHIEQFHPWNLSPSQAIALQKELRGRLRASADIPLEHVQLVAGVDVSCVKHNPTLTAGILVWNRETGAIVEQRAVQRESTFPYIPGLLSFREIPVLAEAIALLQTVPHVLLVDGQGIAHPRRLGIAAHLGLLVNVPTVGIAKSVLCGEADEPDLPRGSTSSLVHEGEEIGRLVRTKDNVNAIVVSPGNGISMDSSVELALACTRGYRLPEPTRLAHNFVNAVRKGEPLAENLQVSLL